MIVVSDTTPIISLLKIDQINLLESLFGEVIVPRAVYDELTVNTLFSNEAELIKNCSFIKIADITNREAVNLLRRVTCLDLGESEAIIYTDETNANLLLMDEVKGRVVAKQMGLNVTGTIGILLEAHDDNLIASEQITSAITIMKRTDRHISQNLYDLLLKKINNHND